MQAYNKIRLRLYYGIDEGSVFEELESHFEALNDQIRTDEGVAPIIQYLNQQVPYIYCTMVETLCVL